MFKKIIFCLAITLTLLTGCSSTVDNTTNQPTVNQPTKSVVTATPTEAKQPTETVTDTPTEVVTKTTESVVTTAPTKAVTQATKPVTTAPTKAVTQPTKPVVTNSPTKSTPKPTPKNDPSLLKMRRQISATNPMFLVTMAHIHPQHNLQKVIDSIPTDIRPYAVIHLDLSWDIPDSKNETYFYNLLKSELETCKKNNIQVLFQLSVAETDYVNIGHIEELYKAYSNILIGVSFVEQSFNSIERMDVIAEHIVLANKYDAYVYWGDRDTFLLNGRSGWMNSFVSYENLADAVSKYSKNFIIGYKSTAFGRFSETESITSGLWLSGLAGNFASRPDNYSWGGLQRRVPLTGEDYPSDIEGNGKMAMFLAPETYTTMSILNSAFMGATVFDGPEDNMYAQTSNGEVTSAFVNATYQAWRLIVNKTIKIPTREEALSRIKVAYQPDDALIDPELFEGLYEQDPLLHRNWLKKTGRYYYIPILPIEITDEQAKAFNTVIKGSEVDNYFTTKNEKVNYFNKLYPQEYSGSMYVLKGLDNVWYTYNPYANSDIATWAQIPLKVNTASELLLNYKVYTYGVIKEEKEKITLHLNNYFTDKSSIYSEKAFWFLDTLQNYINDVYNKKPNDIKLRETIITVKGCTVKPTYTLTDMGKHKKSNAAESFKDGVFTLTVSHNGPVDVVINCKGKGIAAKLLPEEAEKSVIRSASTILECEAYNEKESCREGAAWDPQGICMQTTGDGYIKYENIDFGSGKTKAELRYHSDVDDREVELRIGSPDGKLIGTAKLSNTGTWPKFGTVNFDLTKVTGVNDLYIVFTNSGISMNYLRFK